MTQLSDLFPIELFNEMVDEKYIRVQTHPGAPFLSIANYAEKAVWDRVWNEATMQCRGLIYDNETMEVVSRPFPKFFNFSEGLSGPLPAEPFEVFEKEDGSLGILFLHRGFAGIATRGSFSSPQAQHATALMMRRYRDFAVLPGLTYLWEIVYPANRIVRDYGDMDDLILLDIIDVESGLSVYEQNKSTWVGPHVQKHVIDSTTSLEQLADIIARTGNGTDTEGVVVRFQNGLRVKMKSSEYARLHKILTGLNQKDIWEHISQGGDVATLADNVPDEFYGWMQETSDSLHEQQQEIIMAAGREFMQITSKFPVDITRKQVAEAFASHPLKQFLFLALDGKKAAMEDLAWRQVKPRGDTAPFRDTGDA